LIYELDFKLMSNILTNYQIFDYQEN